MQPAIHTPEARAALLQRTASGFSDAVRDPRRNQVWLPQSVDYALTLLEWGASDTWPEAASILAYVIATQDHDRSSWEASTGLRYGNYLRGTGDAYPYDLNLSTFHLLRFVRVLHLHREKLPAELVDALLGSINLALDHIDRRNVTLDYTNIALMEAAVLICASELVGRDELLRKGLEKLHGWLDLTARQGIREFNSTQYMEPDLVAATVIRRFSSSPQACLMARLVEERLWWHAACYYHFETGQWSAPQSRAYALDRTGGPAALKWIVYKATGLAHLVDPARREAIAALNLMRDNSVWVWVPKGTPVAPESPSHATAAALAEFDCPPYVAQRFLSPTQPGQTWERTMPGQDIAAYRTPNYTIGWVNQHPANPHTVNCGVWYAAEADALLPFRLLYAEFCRRRNTRFNALGTAVCVGDRSRMLALYGLWPGREEQELDELAVDLVIPQAFGRAGVEIWNGERECRALPATLDPAAPICIRDGATFFAIRALPIVDLGRTAAVTVENSDGDLQVSIWAYQGIPQVFGAQAGRRALVGFALEVGDMATFGDFAAFRTAMQAGRAEFEQDGVQTSASYVRGDTEVALAWDPTLNPMDRRPGMGAIPQLSVQRRVSGRALVAPILDDPWAQIRADEAILLHGAALAATQQPIGLWATPTRDTYAIWQPHAIAQPIQLHTPLGDLRCPAFPMGLLRLFRTESVITLEIHTAAPVTPLYVRPIGTLRVTLNGAPVVLREPAGESGDGWMQL